MRLVLLLLLGISVLPAADWIWLADGRAGRGHSDRDPITVWFSGGETAQVTKDDLAKVMTGREMEDAIDRFVAAASRGLLPDETRAELAALGEPAALVLRRRLKTEPAIVGILRCLEVVWTPLAKTDLERRCQNGTPMEVILAGRVLRTHLPRPAVDSIFRRVALASLEDPARLQALELVHPDDGRLIALADAGAAPALLARFLPRYDSPRIVTLAASWLEQPGSTRAAAIRTLTRATSVDPTLRPTILRAYGDADPRVREAVAEWLGRHGGVEDLPLLRSLAKAEPDAFCQAVLAAALEAIQARRGGARLSGEDFLTPTPLATTFGEVMRHMDRAQGFAAVQGDVARTHVIHGQAFDAVTALADGVVRRVASIGELGWVVITEARSEAGQPFCVVYGRLDGPPRLSPGDVVSAGALIGVVAPGYTAASGHRAAGAILAVHLGPYRTQPAVGDRIGLPGAGALRSGTVVSRRANASWVELDGDGQVRLAADRSDWLQPHVSLDELRHWVAPRPGLVAMALKKMGPAAPAEAEPVLAQPPGIGPALTSAQVEVRETTWLPTVATAAAIGDCNGDGRPDLVLVDQRPGFERVQIAIADESGTYALGKAWGAGLVGRAPGRPRILEDSGDGRAAVVLPLSAPADCLIIPLDNRGQLRADRLARLGPALGRTLLPSLEAVEAVAAGGGRPARLIGTDPQPTQPLLSRWWRAELSWRAGWLSLAVSTEAVEEPWQPQEQSAKDPLIWNADDGLTLRIGSLGDEQVLTAGDDPIHTFLRTTEWPSPAPLARFVPIHDDPLGRQLLISWARGSLSMLEPVLPPTPADRSDLPPAVARAAQALHRLRDKDQSVIEQNPAFHQAYRDFLIAITETLSMDLQPLDVAGATLWYRKGDRQREDERAMARLGRKYDERLGDTLPLADHRSANLLLLPGRRAFVAWIDHQYPALGWDADEGGGDDPLEFARSSSCMVHSTAAFIDASRYRGLVRSQALGWAWGNMQLDRLCGDEAPEALRSGFSNLTEQWAAGRVTFRANSYARRDMEAVRGTFDQQVRGRLRRQPDLSLAEVLDWELYFMEGEDHAICWSMADFLTRDAVAFGAFCAALADGTKPVQALEIAYGPMDEINARWRGLALSFKR